MFEFDDAIFGYDGGDALLSWDMPENFLENSLASAPDNNVFGYQIDTVGETSGNDLGFDPNLDSDSTVSGSIADAPTMSAIDYAKMIAGGGLDAAGKFMRENRLWAPALGMAAGALDRYATTKQQREDVEEARRRKRMGVVSGRGLSLWRSSPKVQQPGG